jgi:hypothetical protein
LNFYDTASSGTALHCPTFIFRRARNTIASPQAVQNGDQIGGLFMRGYDGNKYHQTSGISAWVDGVVDDGVVPTQIRFFTGTTTTEQKMTINSSGNIGIGTPTPSAKLAINGGLHVGGDTDPGDNNLLVDGTAQFAGNVGFYNTAPVAQPAHTIDADGTLADITTKFNALLLKLETLGLVASA